MEHTSHRSRLHEIDQICVHLKEVAQMIEEERYCLDIISELKSVRLQLKQLQNTVLQDHIDHCLVRAAGNNDPSEKRKLSIEVIKLIEATAS